MSKDRTVADLERITFEIGASLMKYELSAQEVFYIFVRLQADAIGSIIMEAVQKLLDARTSGDVAA